MVKCHFRAYFVDLLDVLLQYHFAKPIYCGIYWEFEELQYIVDIVRYQ